MNRTFVTACLFALPLVGGACTDAPIGDEEANLPGDIDNSTDGPSGKGDAWNFANDPARLAQNLNYTLTALPKTGKLDKPVWAARYPNAVGKAPVAWSDTYWPTVEGSTNTRWLGSTSKSPLEKYDAAFNAAPGCATMPAETCGDTAKAEWDQYFTCAGPAAKWQMRSFQSLYQQIDGLDNDRDGKKDECDSDDDEGAQGWWGLCHAWTPAALLEPEPQRAVTYQGQKFEVADIKALIVTVYDNNEALMLGGRCNATTFTPNNTTSANDACFDANAGAMHVVLTNFLGINDSAVAMDRTATTQVWNQPITGYTVTQQDKVTATRAMACVGGTGSTYTHNLAAKSLYEVTTTVEYLVEGSADTRPLGMSGYLSQDTYHYILELGSTGKVIGGRYCTGTEGPDFLWAPIRVSTANGGRNPNVKWDKVQTLIGLSIADATTPSTGTEKAYENTAATTIPDNAPAGASIAINVPDTFAFKGLAVTVDIEHTWRGDLLVELLKDGAKVATLSDRAGGSAQNLTQTFTFTPAQVGGDAAKATWTLKVTDTAAQDTGRVKSFKLAFAQ